MSIRIEYAAVDGKHIDFKHDGSIELFIKNQPEMVVIDYRQASILKAMVLAEHRLLTEAIR